MLRWTREIFSALNHKKLKDRTICESLSVVPSRKVRFFSRISSPKESKLRSIVRVDGYQSPKISANRLQNCVFDAASGLVVLEDGSLDETCRYIASYYVDTKRDGLAEDVRGSANSTIDDDLIHVFHRSCGAYGHFILDGLCAVALLKDLILERRLKILVPTIFPAWITEVLAGVGFGPGHIVKASGVVRCRSLTTSTMLMAVNCFLPNPETIAKLRMLVDSPVVPPNRRIYLTRDGAYSPRFVRNEAETQLLFKNAGFEIVNPTSMTFPKQVELFASAKVIAGNHGSALVNMIFARSGAQIIDLMPEDWVGYWGEGGAPERWLLNLTGACGHDYSLVLSRSEMVGNPPLPNGSTILPRIDATTDLNSVQAAISELS